METDNVFLELSDAELRNALDEYKLYRHSGSIKEDGLLAHYRDVYCKEHMSGLILLITDLLYAGAHRWRYSESVK